jgi:hypothetical protein
MTPFCLLRLFRAFARFAASRMQRQRIFHRHRTAFAVGRKELLLFAFRLSRIRSDFSSPFTFRRGAFVVWPMQNLTLS